MHGKTSRRDARQTDKLAGIRWGLTLGGAGGLRMSRSSLAFAVPFVVFIVVASALGGCASSRPQGANPSQGHPPGQDSQMIRIPSKDGTPIAVECAGAGPSLVMVHGGIGDRTRWTPMFPLLSSRFTVCAMDRRGHGASGDSPDYTLQKEAEDVAAVVNSRPGTVFVLGHSYGGVCALEATFLTERISKLVLYEPPLQDRVDLTVAARMERMIQDGEREQALVTFLRKVVMLSPTEVAAIRLRPSWPGFVATIESQIRQMRALAVYRFDAKRMSTVRVPTLLVTGSDTASPQLKQAISSLLGSLPNPTMVVLEGQQHNAMDTARRKLAEAVMNFLLGSTLSTPQDDDRTPASPSSRRSGEPRSELERRVEREMRRARWSTPGKRPRSLGWVCSAGRPVQSLREEAQEREVLHCVLG